MKFETQYDSRERIRTASGERTHILREGRYTESGDVVLVEKGVVDVYGEIQSHRQSCDINVILERYRRGDQTALSKLQGVYMDVTGMPRTMAEVLNYTADMRSLFESLPVEVRGNFDHSFEKFIAQSMDSDFAVRAGFVRQEASQESGSVFEKGAEVSDS